MTAAFELSEKRRLLLEKLLAKEGVAAAEPRRIPRRAGGGPAPLSFGQQRLWFLHQMEPASPAYNLTDALRLSGALDERALARALAEVTRRHEVLRTVFPAPGGEPMQEVLAWRVPTLPRADLSALPEPARAAETARGVAELARTPFDLARGPLFAPALLLLAADPPEHLLVLRMHHAISDGWSMGLLARELTALYAAFASGRPSPLAELPLQYADFAAWQREHLKGETLEPLLRFWQERLAGAPTLLEIPADRPRPPVQAFRGGREPVRLPAATAAVLRNAGQSQGATIFMAVTALVGTLLRRYTGREELLLGTPIANRNRPEIEDLIGFFVNTLVLRLDLAGDPAFRTLLARVRAIAMEADAHQDLPFEKLVDALDLPRDLSHSPLFQVMVSVQSLPPGGGERQRALAVTPYGFEMRAAQFDLHFLLAEGPDGIAGELEYRSDLFDPPTVRRLARHFEALAAAAAGDPGLRVSELPLLASPERHQLLSEWNDTADAYAALADEATLHGLIAEQERRTPGAPAVELDGDVLTYAELGGRARALACRLRELGCGPESRVAVALERSPELMVALLATLAAGAAYVPLDPDYPRERLAFMLEDARPAVLLTSAVLLPFLPSFTGPVVTVDRADEPPAATDFAAFAPATGDGRQLAYMIYTSGSTGRPKGAMVHHRAIVNRLVWMQDAYRLTAADTVLQKTPVSFDVSVWELFWPLLAGARLVLAKPGGHRDPAYMADLIARTGVSVLHFVPSMLQAFLEHGDLSGCAGLRLVVTSGEALPAALARRCRERLPAARLENLYGPTEAAVDVTRWSCADDRAPIPIGRPIANVRIHLLDPHLRPAPIGIPGELYIAGTNVGRGYLDRPDLTAERFVPDPFAAAAGEGPGRRAYRTGDLARHLADGAIEFLGRIDQQVKIRGFRIEPGEIEAALARHPAVREAAVVARDERGVRRLVAYVVLASEAEATLDDLRSFLQERLPEHMVPALFVILPALPLSPSGKLDRGALPAPDPAAALAATEHVAPATPAEQALARVWTQVLEVDRVGATDNFFALGGDSILSLRVLSRLREAGWEATLLQLFQHQTVRELARELRRSEGEETAPPAIAPFEMVTAADRERLPADLEDAYPLTRIQAGMLFHSQIDPRSAVYHDILGERLRGRFDEQALRRTLARIFDRHPILRTSFALLEMDQPLQLVHREVPLPLAVDDLRHLPAEERERILTAWLEAERHRPYDWERPPLLRFHVHRLEDEVFQHTLSFHHSVLDGWSAAALRTELVRTYMALVEGTEPPDEAPPPTAFRDFVRLEQEALASPATREFWQLQLVGAAATPLPRWPRPPVAASRAHDLYVPIDPGRTAALRQAAREAQVPLKSLLCAAHLRVIGRLTGEEDLITGLVVNGRLEVTGTEEVLGLFLNTVPFRIRLGGESWSDLARAAFELEKAILPHRRFPLGEIQGLAGGLPLFETAFGITQFHVYKGVREAGDGLLALTDYGYEETNFPLGVNFELDVDGSRIALRLNSSDAEIDPAQVRAIGACYDRALAALAADPRRPHAEASLLSDEERRQVVAEWSSSGPAAARSHAARLFAERARATPEALAVVADGGRLTYAELDRRANQVARSLRMWGVHPGSHVAVCLDRTPDLLVGLLAIWKAGGAYVPLDPGYPLERLMYMLEDSQATLLVSRDELLASLPSQVDLLPIVRLDTDGWLIDAQSDEELPDDLDPESVAYVLYTSGSTGRPKGVLVPHGGLGNLAAAQTGLFDVRPGDRVLQFASLSFDASVSEILIALLGGAELHLTDAPRLMPGPDLVALLAERRITHLTLPPSALSLLPPSELPDLRALIVAGEACPIELIRRWRGDPERRRVVNAYGPTEATVCATAGEVTDADARPWIGRPIHGARVLVLDQGFRPVPIGTPGELWLGGAGLALGYWRRPDLTAERFSPAPFGAEPGARFYRSGDLGRWLPDGRLDYLGRIDHQVKVRGVRVEPGEIEGVLASHPEVREAAIKLYSVGGDPRLGAYVVPARQSAAEASDTLPGDLRAFLRTRLPEPMIPSAFVVLDALPLTPNGKLDRHALPDPGAARPGREESYVEPRTANERQLATIWQEVLGIERIGRDDKFLELGGHSLLAMQLILRIRAEFGTDLALNVLYGSSLAEMAEAVARPQAGRVDSDLLAELLDEVEQMSTQQIQEALSRPAEREDGQ